MLKVKDIEVGGIYPTRNCGELVVEKLFKVKARREVYAEVRFVTTGTTKKVLISHVRSGGVKDTYYPSVYNVGYLGGASTTEDNKAYRIWNGMLARCYNVTAENYPYYGGVGVKVERSWYNFSYYLSWWKKNYIEGYHLDKDLLSEGDDKVYSEDTCCFVPKGLNSTIGRGSRGSGVSRIGNKWRYGGDKYPQRYFKRREEAFKYRSECFQNRLDKFLKEESGVLPERVLEAIVVVLQKEVDRLEE